MEGNQRPLEAAHTHVASLLTAQLPAATGNWTKPLTKGLVMLLLHLSATWTRFRIQATADCCLVLHSQTSVERHHSPRWRNSQKTSQQQQKQQIFRLWCSSDGEQIWISLINTIQVMTQTGSTVKEAAPRDGTFFCVFFLSSRWQFSSTQQFRQSRAACPKGKLKLPTTEWTDNSSRQPTNPPGTEIRSAIKTFLRQPSVVKTRQACFRMW